MDPQETPPVTPDEQKPTDPSPALTPDPEAAPAGTPEESLIKDDDPRGVQERINQITREKHDALRLSGDKDEVIRILQADIARAAAQTTPAPEPKREDFDEFDDAGFIAARVSWEVGQKTQEAENTRVESDAQAASAAKTREAEQSLATQRDDLVTKGKGEFKDWDAVISEIPANIMDPSMVAAIVAAGNDPGVAYFLGKNLDEAARISQLPPMEKAYGIAQIKTKLDAAKVNKSNAPPPLDPLNPGDGSTDVDYARMAVENPKEWIRLRNEGKI